METKNKIMFLLATLFLLVFTTTAYGSNHLFIVLSSDDPIMATHAFRTAQEALKSGDEVTVFLVRDGAKLASLWNPTSYKMTGGKTPLQILSRLIKSGAEVLICPKSMLNCKINEDELLDGVEPTESETVAAEVASEKGKMIKF
jgi:predicted peroxiredoxin